MVIEPEQDMEELEVTVFVWSNRNGYFCWFLKQNLDIKQSLMVDSWIQLFSYKQNSRTSSLKATYKYDSHTSNTVQQYWDKGQHTVPVI